MTALEFFIDKFLTLNRDKAHGEPAPNQPILLLAVIQLYENGKIPNNIIFITPELTDTFARIWNALVIAENKHPQFALPFYHLKNTKGNWWKLIPKSGAEMWINNKGSMKYFSNLSEAVSHAEIDDTLASLLLDKNTRDILKNTLLNHYFPETKHKMPIYQGDKYVQQLTNEILNEPVSEYKNLIKEIKKNEKPDLYQVEVYNRSAIFRRQIVKIYDETCSISGLRISAMFTISMVDACHIVPFSKDFDNSLSNGIALCPNLHRAFDRGLISVNESYEVMLSQSFKENSQSEYSFSRIEGKTIALPSDKDFWPSLANFEWHRKNVFKK